jgi:phage baseplate assembly protein W
MTTTAPDFGTCWGTPNGSDLSMPSYMASGTQVVAEAILRRWSTSRGQLIDDPNYGFNVMDLVSDDLDKKGIAYAQQQLAQECTKDERVRSATVVVTLAADGNMTITATVTTTLGPTFKLVAAVSAVSVSLLLVSP